MNNISFTPQGFDDYVFWQENNKKILKQINKLLKDIARNAYDGIGHPEPLKDNLSGCYSRHITKDDRLVYRIINDIIEVISCKGHYDDK